MRKSKQLRSASWVAAIAAVVALAVPAFASGASYGGTVRGGGTLSFKTVTQRGKITGVRAFSWKNVPTTCLQGAYSYTGSLPFSLTVKNRAFAITSTGGGLAQAVSGLITNRQRKASGVLNVYGNLAPRHSNCATGQLRWSATRR